METVYESAPEGFLPLVEVSGCYIEIDKKLLLLQRGPNESQAGKWGVPAGKLEKNESPKDGAIRELFEETGILIQEASRIDYVGTLYIQKVEFDYIFHLFRVNLEITPDVRLSHEHQNYKWAGLQDLEELPLINSAKESLNYYTERISY